MRARKRHEQQCYRSNVTSFATAFKAMLHEATSLATYNATTTNKKPFKLQKGCYTQATFLAALRKVEGRSTFLATRNATTAVAKWGVTREFFSSNLQRNVCCVQVARKIVSCNMALSLREISYDLYSHALCARANDAKIVRCRNEQCKLRNHLKWSVKAIS